MLNCRYEPNRLTVVLRRRSTHIEFGFQIRGGCDRQAIYDNDDEVDDCRSFYIDHVAPNSIAWNSGSLHAGQRILSLDNMSLRHTTMSELLAYIDQRLCITLCVLNNRYRIQPRDELSPIESQYAKHFERSLKQQHYERPLSIISERREHMTLCKMRDDEHLRASSTSYYTVDVPNLKEERHLRQLQLLPIRVCILETYGEPLGITIIGRSGRVDKGGGLFISNVEHESLADRAGLRAGDRILEINGHIVETVDSTLTDDWLTGKSVTLGFYDRQFPKCSRKERDRWSRRFCSFDEALDLLRSCRTLDLRIAKS